MKLFKALVVCTLLLLVSAPAVFAGDFDWARDFNIQAQADPSGFRARLATRFHIGDVQVNAVLGNIGNPTDAYLVLRLGEMCGRSPEYVINKYKSNKGQGWGKLAKSMGIKPGSAEFHALKRGHDMRGGYDRSPVLYSSYDSGKGKEKKVKSKGKGKKNKKW